MRELQSLNEIWDYRAAEGPWDKREIPYADLPVGFAECRRTFDVSGGYTGRRAFLRLEGITYEADVVLNGEALGRMLPYVPYEFEVTEKLRPVENELRVAIRDLPAAFGPAEGWENYSGVIRDVSVVYTDASRIADVFFHTELAADASSALCHVELTVDGPVADGLSLTLRAPDGQIACQTIFSLNGAPKQAFSFPMEHPLLWSPESPVLYTLETELLRNGVPCDRLVQRVGFKELKVQGKRFLLNGKPLFLMGVCRHDLWGDQGHVMTREQMRQDMAMIKATGANFVRLVHYPHHPYILELADELGLMVSEEPGLWWSDMKDQAIFDGSLEVMRRTVLRDRSHVSVAFWLSFNECIFTPEFLRAAAQVCRENDPVHLVSGANCMDIPMTRKYFAECGLDFYTMHPYAPTDERMLESARELNDKPLLFTEWGGYHVFNNPDLFGRFLDTLRALWENPDDQPGLAGAFLWCWAEVFEFNRAAPACHDGLLCEALVDRFRRPLPNYAVFQEKCLAFSLPRPEHRSLEILSPQVEEAPMESVSLTGAATEPSQAAAWNDMMALAAQPIPRFVFGERKLRVMRFGPVLPETPDRLGSLPVSLLEKPLVVMKPASGKVFLPLNGSGRALYLIGSVSMPKGFPIEGAFGEEAGQCAVCYADGGRKVFPLRNGHEITTAAGWFGPSRIRPVASNAPCVLRFINDPDRERYVAHLLRLPLETGRELCGLEIRAGDGYALLYYGVTIAR